MKPSHPAPGEASVDPLVYWDGCFSTPKDSRSNPIDHNPQVFREPETVVARRRRRDGWTAARQGMFLNTLANTGSVATAAEAAGITPRSAYRLRNHPDGAAFTRGWEAAMMTAANRLTAVAP